MGQFKPMVKMMTTEPTVELKLKKGGKVEKKMQLGGVPSAAPVTGGLPARGGDMASVAPGKPDMRRRLRMMKAMGAGPSAPVGTASRMMKEGGETAAEHKSEMKKMAATSKELKEHKSLPASKAHKGLKTGGVVMGQSGFKTGGAVKYAKGGGVEGNVSTSHAGVTNTTTGEVKKGQAGYKKGGAAKKFARGGSVNDSGKPEGMPQGRKKPSAPVSIDRLSGTFKKGGAVKMAEGGAAAAAEAKLQKQLDEGYESSARHSAELEDAMNPLSMVKELYGKAKKAFMGEPKGESVTKTKESVTVTPIKKRKGGAC